jgi:endonuclease YncB( thermonuclease family)
MGNCLFNTKLNKCNLENTKDFTLKGTTKKCKVIDVYDGDTVTLAFSFSGNFYKKRCRISGVDCPEIRTKNLKEKEYGLKAKEFTTTLLLNKLVIVSFVGDDKYGRLLGKLYVDGKDVADIIIISGNGYAYDGGKKTKFEEVN